MPLKSYGVLVGKCTKFERDNDPHTPHCSLTIDGVGHTFRAAVNVKSKEAPSELVYHFAQDFEHPMLARVTDLPAGFNKLANTPTSGALDYIRANLFSLEDVIALPPNMPGVDNDLSDVIESLANRAINDPETRIFIFGEPFPDGIHDVHMNQGNVAGFVGDDGVWQDGGLMIHTPSLNRWSAVFLAFQSQAIHTDDEEGHTEPGSSTFEDIVQGHPVPVPTEPQPMPGQPAPTQPIPEPGQRDLIIRIVSAMVNPEGPEGQPGFEGRGEWVQIVNMLPQEIDLKGWAFLNKDKRKSVIGDGNILPPAGFLRVAMSPAVPLGNNGGLITLVDPQGLKIHGVSYTAAQAQREGYPVGF